MSERIFGLASRLINGKWKELDPEAVAKVDHDGNIEGTDYHFHRPVIGGVAVTSHSSLLKDGDHLINPATGDEFVETKSKKGYFCKAKGIFVRPYFSSNDGEGE